MSSWTSLSKQKILVLSQVKQRTSTSEEARRSYNLAISQTSSGNSRPPWYYGLIHHVLNFLNVDYFTMKLIFLKKCKTLFAGNIKNRQTKDYKNGGSKWYNYSCKQKYTH